MALKRTFDIQTDRYENCFSLGYYCGTASTLSKLGLRSQSGPFDWIISNYSGVLKQIENEFTDFMNLANLEVDSQDIQIFNDKKYGFSFLHDIQSKFEDEYEIIRDKYDRRAHYFLKAIREPSVFFRTIRGQEEIDYINHNWQYADKLVKRYNLKNRIIYVLRAELIGLTDEVEAYTIPSQYIWGKYEMRHLFDFSPELLGLCSGLIDFAKIEANIEFDEKYHKQETIASYANKCAVEEIDGLDRIILKGLNAESGEGIYLWGAGKYGISLADYLIKRKVRINGIVDNKLYGQRLEGLRIISFNEVRNGAKIFIAISSPTANTSIDRQIKDSRKDIIAVHYADLCEDDFYISKDK